MKNIRYESEKLVLKKTRFDEMGLIQSIVTNFETEFLNKGISLKYYGNEEIISAD